jgi:hypothetical protein
MAIYHLNAHPVSRGRGQSAIAKAAYNSRSKLEDERTGIKQDYSRLGGLQFSGIFAPKDAPEWAKDREAFWNEVERREDESNRANTAQLAREIRIALPHELTDEQREWLVKDWVREQLVRKGMVADVNIHEPHSDGDDRNYHAHILVTMREIGPDGFGPKVREWNSKAQLEQWRESWERMANKQLERHGHDARIDRRSLEEQGIEREPTTHRGPHVDAIERQGIVAENTRQTMDAAAELAQLRAALSNITRDIAALRNEQVAEQAIAAGGLPEPANSNEISIDLAPVAETLEAAPAEALNLVNETAAEIAGGFKTVAAALSIFDPDQPVIPPTKEIAANMQNAAAADRRAHIERMLTDRAYKLEQETRAREERERQAQREEEYQRTRQRY